MSDRGSMGFIPEVGDTCLFRYVGVKFHNPWIKTKVLFWSAQLFVLEHNASGNHFCKRLGEIEFLPPPQQEPTHES